LNAIDVPVSNDDNEITRIITDRSEIYETYVNLALTAKEEVLMAVISDYWIVGNPSFWRDIRPLANSRDEERPPPSGKANHETAKFRLLIPIVNENNKAFVSSVLRGIEWREIEPNGVSFAIYDRSKVILVEHEEPPSSENAHGAVASAVLTSNKQTVLSLASVFNALWRESEHAWREREARKHEQRISKQSKLIQDILSHDIRNYNQIASLSAEILAEKLDGDPDGLRIIAGLQAAVDGSTALLEKARKLGRFLAEENPHFYSVNLVDSIRRSLAVVRRSQAKKEITWSDEGLYVDRKAKGDQEPSVIADELLDEVFTNVISNSAKYTDGQKVNLEVKIEPIKEHPKNSQLAPTLQIGDAIESGTLHSSYWKISISDMGKGIPDAMKNQVFARYLMHASGTGLGMSIVHALVIERYKGKIMLRNRVSGDYRQGTTIEIWLPMAASA
jgi:signal transduction histidine kinase